MRDAQMVPDALMLERLVRSLLGAAAAASASGDVGVWASSVSVDGADAATGADAAAEAGTFATSALTASGSASGSGSGIKSDGNASVVTNGNDAEDDEAAMRRGRFWLMAVQIYARVRDHANLRLSNELHRLMVRRRRLHLFCCWKTFY